MPVTARELQVIESSEESRIDLRLLVDDVAVGTLGSVGLGRPARARAETAPTMSSVREAATGSVTVAATGPAEVARE